MLYSKRLGKLAKRNFFLRAQALSASSSSILFPQHDPLTHKHLLYILAFGRVGEYFLTIYALAPFSPTPMSSNATSTFTTLHLESNDYFLIFFKDYELN
jgi:hypothetical protein